MPNLVTLSNLDQTHWASLVDSCCAFACAAGFSDLLKHKNVGIYFTRPSTRTRSSFIAAVYKLGGNPISYGPEDLQLVTGETMEDTATVLSGFLSALIVRTNGAMSEMLRLGSCPSLPVISAMSAEEHPTQAISDFATIKLQFGKLAGLRMLYVGEGNNTARALLFAAALTPGFTLELATPKNYSLPLDDLAVAKVMARNSGATINQHHTLDSCMVADVIYTTRWETMGTPHSGNWLDSFDPFRLTVPLFGKYMRNSSTVLMHDLPVTRGREVTAELFDNGPNISIKQAHNKVYGAMSALTWCVQ